MKTVILLGLVTLFIFPLAAPAAIYTCTTEFGESVPLQISATRNGKPAPDLSRNWNQGVRNDQNLKSKIKSVELASTEEKATFEWRYAKRLGPTFALDVQCPATGKCSGKFVNAKDPAALTFDTKLFDQRFASQRGYVQLNLGDREELSLRIRVFKETEDPTLPSKQILSSSGEHMLLTLEPRFIIDVGVDEHLKVGKDLTHRLAALEIKVRCKL